MSIERLVFKLYISEWGLLRIITIAIPRFALHVSRSKNVLKLNSSIENLKCLFRILVRFLGLHQVIKKC